MSDPDIGIPDDPDGLFETEEETPEEELWFLPGPMEAEPDLLLPTPRVDPAPGAQGPDWTEAQAGCAARLAHVSGRLGALDERLRRGPEGWRHRLALIEAVDLSWTLGDRVGPDRLALWLAMRLAGVQDDAAALARVGWAVRRLSGGPGPEADLGAFLGRHDPAVREAGADRFADMAESWRELVAEEGLHPIVRACMGYHLWALAGLGRDGDRMEAAVTAARIAAGEGTGAVFVPLAAGGGGVFRSGGTPVERLGRWLGGMERAVPRAMRHLDDLEAWEARAAAAMGRLSGRTPPALRAALAEWPLVSAPMAERLTGASRAAVQRNLSWMEDRGLIREVTGQGRFRMWRAAV